MVREIHEPEISVGEGPIGDGLIAGDRRHRDDERAEHVVVNLTFVQETSAIGCEGFRREPQRVALAFLDIEIQVQPAKQDQDEAHVPGMYEGDPPQLERLHGAKLWCEIGPGQNRDRQPEPRESEKPFRQCLGPRRPVVDGRQRDRSLRALRSFDAMPAIPGSPLELPRKVTPIPEKAKTALELYRFMRLRGLQELGHGPDELLVA